MAYKRKAKKKEDLSKNPDQGVDTSMGRYYLEMGLVKIIDKARQRQALIDIMRGDEEIGLYNDNQENHGYERYSGTKKD